MSLAIKVENLSKAYQIGQIGTGTISRDVERWFTTRILGKEDPFLKVGETNDRTKKSESNIVWSLKDINLEIEQGDAVGIIGKNGAGKSTLLKLLSRVTAPTTGSIKIKGRVASLLEVGTGFHPELTGRENIYLNGSILGMRKREIDRKFDQIVDFSGVERYIDTPVKRYSSGMYVRLAFAVAAHLDSEILIVDEVLAVGDAEFQKKCLGKMDDMRSRGNRTLLFVSHNMAAVASLCPRAVWLHKGQVHETGNSELLVRNYMNTGSWQVSSRRWTCPGDAPGDDRVRLLSARLLQEQEEANLIDINKDLYVEVEFEVLQQCRNLITGASFYNPAGVCLFNSCDWRPNSLSAGIYKKSVKVPAQTLAEDRHSVLIQCVFYDPDVKSVVEKDVLRFESVDYGGKGSVKGPVHSGWPGVVRLGLEWSTPLAHVSDKSYEYELTA